MSEKHVACTAAAYACAPCWLLGNLYIWRDTILTTINAMHRRRLCPHNLIKGLNHVGRRPRFLRPPWLPSSAATAAAGSRSSACRSVWSRGEERTSDMAQPTQSPSRGLVGMALVRVCDVHDILKYLQASRSGELSIVPRRGTTSASETQS